MRVVVDNFFTIILIANILLSIVIVFRERKETAQTWAWLLVLMFIPIVGFLLYIFFGRGISQDKIFDLKIQGKIGKNLEIEEDKQALMRGLYPHPPTGQVDVKQLIYMLTVFESTLYTTGNEVTLFTDGREKFDALIEDIKQAKDHIHLQYYIYRGDALGKEVRDALTEAAQRGVKVRVLLDAWGSTQVNAKFFHELQVAGGEVAFFFSTICPLYQSTNQLSKPSQNRCYRWENWLYWWIQCRKRIFRRSFKVWLLARQSFANLWGSSLYATKSFLDGLELAARERSQLCTKIFPKN